MEASLKVKNLPMIGGYVIANLWVLYLLIFGEAPDLSWTQDLSKLVPGAIATTIFAVAISELIGGETKARLVFRKWTNPLPGSRAFSVLGPRDPRVDMSVLKKRFGKPELPDKADDQNIVWYKIYKLNESRPSVAYANQYYLLMRDLAFVTILLGIAAIGAGVYRSVSLHIWGVMMVMLFGEFLLAMRSAASLGRDLVCNVLAEESAKP